jgi:hypothetical protein
LRLAVTFADYLLSVLGQTPDVEVLLTQDAPFPHHALGMPGRGDAAADVAATGEGAVDGGKVDGAQRGPMSALTGWRPVCAGSAMTEMGGHSSADPTPAPKRGTRFSI